MEEPQTELEVYVPGTDPEIDDIMALLHESLDERIEATSSKRDEMQELIDRMTAIQLEHEYDGVLLAQKLDQSLPAGNNFIMKEVRPLIAFPVSQQCRDNKALDLVLNMRTTAGTVTNFLHLRVNNTTIMGYLNCLVRFAFWCIYFMRSIGATEILITPACSTHSASSASTIFTRHSRTALSLY